METQKVCSECKRKRERCRAVSVNSATDEVEWTCPKCYKALGYEVYLYQRKPKEA